MGVCVIIIIMILLYDLLRDYREPVLLMFHYDISVLWLIVLHSAGSSRKEGEDEREPESSSYGQDAPEDLEG